MKKDKDTGQFNLDYEESVLLRSRLGKTQKLLQFIYEKSRYLLGKKSYMSEHEKDVVRDIRDLSSKDD